MAKLLVITQKVDINDPILGFFHRWLEVFSEKFEKITVICLWKGEYNFPGNVKIVSLGKEKFENSLEIENWKLKIIRRILRGLRFYKHIWQMRREYDSVFVHMNPIYAVLGGLLWRIWGKKIYLWYTHPAISLKLKLAVKFADKIFTASKNSFPLKSSKVIVTGHGIDTDLFRRDYTISKEINSVLYVGRLAAVKNLNILDEAVQILKKEGFPIRLNIVGGDIKVPNVEMPRIYNQNEILINLTNAGSFDKTILEAMACENLVVATNPILKDLDERIVSNDVPEALADSLTRILNLSEEEKINLGRKLREYVVKNHNLNTLALKIAKYYEA